VQAPCVSCDARGSAPRLDAKIDIRKGKRMDLRSKFISASIVAALSFVVSLSVALYSERSPELTYETFSSKSLTIDNEKRNVLNYRIDNNGRKEAEKVEVAFKYKNGVSGHLKIPLT
jgi:hypothetical protein